MHYHSRGGSQFSPCGPLCRLGTSPGSSAPVARPDARTQRNVRWETSRPTASRTRRGTRDWFWTAAPSANIGAATGNGIVAIDIDPRHGGEQSLAELQRKHGELPATLTTRTGGGGRHLLFRSDAKLANSAAALGPGLDVRGDGGYVVAPPSLHISGVRYEWLIQTEPSQLP